MSIMSPSTDILTVPYSEDAIAIQFSGRFGETWKYVAKWNQWLFFDGYCWREDDKLEVFNLGREMCREIAITANETKPKQANSRIVAGVLSFARADPMHAAGADWWDRDPNILGCATSTVNLRTSEVAAPDPDDYITRRAAVDLGGDCPTWKAFLDRVTGGNYDLQLYLQRAVGYCLTGLTSEHVIFFLYGLGANGKSVFVNTIAGLLGDYSLYTEGGLGPRHAAASLAPKLSL